LPYFTEADAKIATGKATSSCLAEYLRIPDSEKKGTPNTYNIYTYNILFGSL
jgi:hypothetical protein